jgi:endonuclease YncB( thermonuclease family)
VVIAANQTKLRIRLLGIDAPEIPHGTKPGQPYGEEARDYLDHLIGGKTVRLDTYGPDRCDSWEARTGEMGDERTKPVDGGNLGQDL